MADGNAAHASLAAFAARAYPSLDAKSYYQLLNVAPGADAAAIRASYYKIAAQLHPDRFHGLPDGETKSRLETIYARVSEAYRTLSNPERRATYDAQLGKGKLRLDLAAPAENPGAKNPEDAIADPQARRFFRLGMVCLGKKDYKGALLNFGFAKMLIPAQALVAEKIAEAERGLAEAAAKTGDKPAEAAGGPTPGGPKR